MILLSFPLGRYLRARGWRITPMHMAAYCALFMGAGAFVYKVIVGDSIASATGIGAFLFLVGAFLGGGLMWLMSVLSRRRAPGAQGHRGGGRAIQRHREFYAAPAQKVGTLLVWGLGLYRVYLGLLLLLVIAVIVWSACS